MAAYSRVKTWIKEILYPADLNAEFDAVQASINGIDKPQMNANSVGTTQLEALSVSASKLASLSVDETKLVDGAVSLQKLATDSVDETKLVDGAATYKKIGSGIGTDVLQSVRHAFSNIPPGSTVSFSHGFVDADGNPRAPMLIIGFTSSGYDIASFHKMYTGLDVQWRAAGATEIEVKNSGPDYESLSIFAM